MERRQFVAGLTLTAAGVVGCGGSGASWDNSPVPANGAAAAILSRRAAAVGALYGNAASPRAAAEQTLDFAEDKFPQYFSDGIPTSTSGAFVYRYYPATQIYLGVAINVDPATDLVESGVYVMGGSFGAAPMFVGLLNQYYQPTALPYLSASNIPTLRGAEIFARKTWATYSATDFNWTNLHTLIDSRMNVARIFVQPWGFQDGLPILPGQPLVDRLMASLADWTALIDYFLSKNVYVIVCFSLQIDYPSTQSWPEDGRSLWTDSAAQTEYVNAWVSFAQHFKGRRGLIFELMNEPHGTTPAEIAGNHAIPKATWNTLYPRTLDAIAAVDPQRWALVEPIWGDPWNFQDLTFAGRSRTVYSFHFYYPHYFTFQGNGGWPAAGSTSYPGTVQDESQSSPALWDRAALALQMAGAVTFASSHGARVMMGEFGCSRGAPAVDRAAWVTDVLSLSESHGFDSIYWDWDGWNPPVTFTLGWGFENTSDESVVLAHFAKN